MKPTPTMTDEQKPFRSKTRWHGVEKGVEYIDFRRTVTAFDRCFWLGGAIDSAGLASRKAFIRRRALHLAAVVSEGAQSYVYFRQERVFLNRPLKDDEIAAISFVLGRGYESAVLVEHGFYGQRGYSVRFARTNGNYSEAFAGSGETAVVLLVRSLLEAKPGSLILLDEPEVSLHPGAQRRLLAFVMQQALTQGHQIVLSTHSPALVAELPTHAIQVVQEVGGGRFSITGASSVSAAFNVLEHSPEGSTTVIVEDELSAEIIKAAFRRLGISLGGAASPRVLVPPGGASAIIQGLLPSEFIAKRSSYFILDGDTLRGNDLPVPSEISGAGEADLKGAYDDAR